MEFQKQEVNNNKIKDFISSIIKKQIGTKLFIIEQKTQKEIDDIKILTIRTKELINKLSSISSKINKKAKIFHPLNSLSKNSKHKKNVLLNQNKFLRKNFTPIKSIKSISKINKHNNRLSRISTKSLDLIIRKNKSNKININTIKHNINSINNKYKIKKSFKHIYKSPLRNKEKNDINLKRKLNF